MEENKYYIEKKLYFVNISKVINILKYINKSSNINKDKLIEICINDLNDIKEYIKTNDILNKDVENSNYDIIDEFIFGIYANLYILNDLLKYNEIINTQKELPFDDFDDIDDFDINILSTNDKYKLQILINFFNAFIIEEDNKINIKDYTIKSLWEIYIKGIVDNFNAYIYITKNDEYILTIDNHQFKDNNIDFINMHRV